ncbi:MAG: UTP--glucose-1-phosphate uridylyltransferase, partial [Lentisphaerae bacterium]|nr:UTP--glucose-1-phosphate uridylyltransferase [Lentisphaerota bacterium]
REAGIAPPTTEDLVRHADLPEACPDDMTRLVMIKLNGGLGTSMGLSKAKSLLPLKDDLTFLDVIAQQALIAGLPLVLMNSFNTQDDTLAFLQEHYPALLRGDLAPTFVQNQFPRICVSDDATHSYDTLDLPDESDTWNPPGHGDLYPAIATSGLLDQLIADGLEVAFVSNSDNLGAFADGRILAYMLAHREDVPFVMEVRERTLMDRKGGHLAKRRADGRLILREIAQCPEDEVDGFQNIETFGYFNTNNLWINLRALKAALEADGDGFLDLPMIKNRKTVEGHDVIQIETAMGSAIELFEGARALVVPRSRYAPVKTTNHLLVVRSDAYELEPRTRQLVLAGSREQPPIVMLSDDYKTITQLEAAFPCGVPSLRTCTSLQIEVPATFAGGVVVQGDLKVTAPRHYAAGVYGE